MLTKPCKDKSCEGFCIPVETAGPPHIGKWVCPKCGRFNDWIGREAWESVKRWALARSPFEHPAAGQEALFND